MAETMSGPWDRYAAQNDGEADGPWAKYANAPSAPQKLQDRGAFGAVNDTVIEAANAAASGVGALANMVSPGNAASKAIDDFVKSGEEHQSDVVKAGRAKFREQLSDAKTLGDEIGAVKDYVAENPLQAAAQVAGSFALPAGAIRGVARGAELLGLGARGASIAARGAGIAAGAGMTGGQAAGQAFDTVEQIPDDVLMKSPQAQELLRQSRTPATPRKAPAGQLEAGNIDLARRPIVRNEDGSISTVRSMSFDEDGKEVLIPTVADDGSRILSDDDAIAQYRRTGKHLGKFDNPADADAYAQQLHEDQDAMYSAPPTSQEMARIRKELATRAGRDASVIPAILGGVTGAFGAEKLLAGIPTATRGVRGALATGAVEAATQGAAAGASQYEAQRAAQEYDPSIDPTKGVAGNAALSAIQGAATGAGVHFATGGGRSTAARAAGADDSVAARYGDVAAAREAQEAAAGDTAAVGAPDATVTISPGSASSVTAAAGRPTYEPGQTVFVQYGGMSFPVEYRGMEANAAAQRPGGQPLARIRTSDGRGYFVPLEALGTEPAPPPRDPVSANALPAPEGYSAGEGFTAQRGWSMPENAPRGIRNNNPGNIGKGAGFAGEVEGNDPRFATFDSPEAGVRAIARNLLAYQADHGLDTVEGIVGRWAPEGENDTAGYARAVAAELGVAPTDRLNVQDPSVLQRLTAAIIQHENGIQPYPAGMIRTGVDAAIAGAPVRAALPAPVIAVDRAGRASTLEQRQADAAARLDSGLTPDIEAAGAQHPGAARPADDLFAPEAGARPDGDPLALPAPVIDIDAAGRARTADQRMAARQAFADRAQLGLTPDVEAAAARHPAADGAAPVDASPLAPAPGETPALPAPRMVVDSEGRAGTPGQLAAEASRRADLGLTADVAAAARQHPGRAQVDVAAHEAATSPTNELPEPTAPQQEAGNYKKGHVRVAGLDISIENPQGSERRGTAPDGSEWVNRMAAHYGYIRGTRASDGDHVDTFVRPGTPADYDGKVFVIDQVDPQTGRFDEPKVMLGYSSQREAERAYRDSYTRGWKGMGKVTPMDMPTFKRWIAEGDATRPAAEYEPAIASLAPEPDILAKNGKPFLTRSAAQRAADAHGNAQVVRKTNGFVARPRNRAGSIVDVAGTEVPTRPTDAGARPAPATASGEVADASVAALPSLRSRAAGITMERESAGRYGVNVEAKEAARLRVPAGGVKTADDAATALASLRKQPQENMVALFTDKDGRPISVLRHGLGGVDNAPVLSRLIAGHAVRLPQAENVWLAHNHPSGNPELSTADRRVTDRYRELTAGGRVKLRGMLAIGADRYGLYDPETGSASTAKIRPARRTDDIPVVERVFKRRATLGEAITGPDAAITIAKSIAKDDSGVLLLNSQNAPVAFLPISPADMARLRDRGALDRVLSGAEQANANGAIIVVKSGEDAAAARNLGAMLNAADIRNLDILAGGKSLAARGEALAAPSGKFESRSSGAERSPRAVSAADGERAARQFMEKLPGAARLRVAVVGSVSEIPEGMRPSPLAEGVYYPAREGGRIYLVADNLPSVDRLHQVLAHEVVGHYGVEALLGDRFQSVLADVRRLARVPEGERVTGREGPGDRNYATMEAVTLAYPDYSSADRAREVLARMAETNTKPYFLQGLYAKLRAALRSLGFDLKLTTSDIRQMVVDAGKFLRRAPAERAQARMVKAAAAMAASERGGASASPRKSVPVAEVSGREFGDPAAGAAAMREQAKEWAAENLRGRQFRNDEQGWGIHVGGRGIKETISRSARLEKLQSVAALPELLKHATLGHSAPPKAAADTSTKAMHTMYAPLRINGQTHVARLMIREANNGEFFYDHDVSGVSNEKALEAASNIDPGSKPGDMGSRSRATLTIDQLRRVVNDEGRAGWNFDPPSGESRRRARQTDSPEFKRWFKNSKVVDGQGEPKVVYHGTKGDFASFSREFIGEGDGHADWGDGFYFADRPDAASTFAEGESGNVMPVYLKMENPATNEVMNSPKIQDALDDGMGFQTVEGVLSKMGYDGIAFTHKGGGTEYVVFNPEQVKSAIGNRGTFDPTSASIMESRAPTAAGKAAAVAPPKERPRETPLERPGEKLSNAERILRDKALGKIGAFTPKETLQERFAAMRERAGQKLIQGVFDQYASLKSVNPTAYMQARLSKGTDGAAEYLIRHGAVKMTQGALDGAGGKGLAQILADLHGEGDHFMAWIAGNRAERLAAEGRERLFSPDDIDTLKKLNLGKMADGRSRREVYAQALKEFNELQRSVLDVAQVAGLINRDARQTWEHDFYVPFYRVMEDDPTGTMGPGQVAGLVGQRAFKALKGGTEKLGDLTANTVSNWSHLLSASMKNLAAQGAMKSAVDMGIAKKLSSAEKGSVRIMVDGKEQHYLVDDPLVMDSLTALHYVGSNDPFMKAMRRFKHVLTTGVTLSPTFRVRNLLRDSISAISIDGDLKLNPLANMVQGWRSTSEESPTMQKLLAGGGAIRFGSYNDGNARNIKRLAEELNVPRDQVLTSPAALGRVLRKAYGWYQETGDRSETINRAAIYDAARGRGKSHLEASYQARDLLDFTSGGTLPAIRILAQVVPFFNARLQGMYKLGRAGVTNTARFATVAAAVGMASSLLYLTMKDDPDYQQLPDWARNSYWIAKLPGTKTMIYIPKPFEVGALGTVVERATELAFGGNDYRLDDFGRTVASVLGDQLSMNPVPGAVKPAMEAAFNYDTFRGRDIDSQGQQKLPPGERFTPTTSAGAVALGRAIGVSPQRIEHLASGYFGWLGMQALNVADYLARPLSNLPENPRRDMNRVDNWFAIGDFLKEADPRGSKYIQRFYDEQAEINQIYAAYSQARAIGDLEHARELAADPKLQLRGLVQAAGRDIQKINQDIKRLERGPGTLEEKRARLDHLYQARARIASMADERVRAAQ